MISPPEISGKGFAFEVLFLGLDRGGFGDRWCHFLKCVQHGQRFGAGQTVRVKALAGLELFHGRLGTRAKDAVSANAEAFLQALHGFAARAFAQQDQLVQTKGGKCIRSGNTVDGKAVRLLKLFHSGFGARTEIAISSDAKFFLQSLDRRAFQAAF